MALALMQMMMSSSTLAPATPPSPSLKPSPAQKEARPRLPNTASWRFACRPPPSERDPRETRPRSVSSVFRFSSSRRSSSTKSGTTTRTVWPVASFNLPAKDSASTRFDSMKSSPLALYSLELEPSGGNSTSSIRRPSRIAARAERTASPRSSS